MIVCHCNVIDAARIKLVVGEALQRVPASEIGAEHVFDACEAMPDCGSCMQLIEEIIATVLDEIKEEA